MILDWPIKFHANRMIADGVMTSYWFYKMAAIASQIYFRFLIWPHTIFRKAQSYRHTKFRPDISIRGRDITTSGFSKQTASNLEILLPVSILTFDCHRHAILHWPIKLYANWMIADGVMTSYWIYKMVAITSQIYFRFLVWPPPTCWKAQSYEHTKFRQISQATAEKLLLPVSENKRPPS